MTDRAPYTIFGATRLLPVHVYVDARRLGAGRPVMIKKIEETSKVVREQIAGFARDSFKNHVCELVAGEPVPVFKCSEPGTWHCGFFVAFPPGAIVFYGDIGEASVFEPRCGGGVAGRIAWLRGAVGSPSYLLEKRQGAVVEDFYAGDVDSLLRERESELRADGIDFDHSGVWQALREDEYSPEECGRELYDAGLADDGVPGYGPSASVIWTIEALRWFVANVKAVA